MINEFDMRILGNLLAGRNILITISPMHFNGRKFSEIWVLVGLSHSPNLDINRSIKGIWKMSDGHT